MNYANTSVLTVFSSSDKRVLLTMSPSELNCCSHGTEVAGMHRTAIIAVLTVVILASRLPVHLLVMGRNLK
jgi:hypothetical protein